MKKINEILETMKSMLDTAYYDDDLRIETEKICLSYITNPSEETEKKIHEQYDIVDTISEYTP